jgi:hypothetical protein
MLRHVIAKRRYRLLAPSGKVVGTINLAFGRPIAEEGGYRCFFNIDGVPWGGLRYAMGSDAVQALLLAMTRAATHLYNSDEFKDGLILLNGDRNLDLPLIDLEDTSAVPNPMLHLTV